MTNIDNNPRSTDSASAAPGKAAREQLPDTLHELLATAINDARSPDPSLNQDRNHAWRGLRKHLRSIEPILPKMSGKLHTF